MNRVDLRHNVKVRNFLTATLIKEVIENFPLVLMMFGVPHLLGGNNTGITLNDQCIIDLIRNDIAGRKR